MAELRIDPKNILGKMKPVHGVNNGPVTLNFTQDASRYFREAGIPFSRLHDTEYPFGSGEFVDIGCVFPDENKDPDDPASYNFALTDLYIQKIRDAGAEVIYRLGASIEHQPIKRRIFPPKDNLHWAKVCGGIIAHLNEGWADGHHMGIRYWEIWNEPELYDTMWRGTWDQYFELYTVTAKYLKERFPDIKVGGPASCSSVNNFTRKFLAHVRQSGAPLDFFSWHGYVSGIGQAVSLITGARELMKEYGFGDKESIYDEWNYVKSWQDCDESFKIIRSIKGAAFNAAMLTVMQQYPVDICTFYDAQMKFTNAWNGLFEPAPMRLHAGPKQVIPRKPYYPFYAFNRLYKLGSHVSAEIAGGDNLYALAAAGGKALRCMVTHFSPESAAPVTVKLPDDLGECRIFLLDDSLNLGETDYAPEITLPANGMALLEWE
ncbi:MAG: hypothetical protein GX628_07940 [Clostridiales bacterium]|nr:hypothetical protein [Clostridiales bacterium]